MKKIRAVYCLTCLIFVISSCSTTKLSTESHLDPKNPVNISLWHYYVSDNKIALEFAIEEFNQTVGREKGVFVDAFAKGNISKLEADLIKSANGVIGAEPMPEIFSCYLDKLIELDEIGIVSDINYYLTEEDKLNYIDEFLENGTLDDGRLVSLPIVKSTEISYTNKTVIEEFLKETGYSLQELRTWEDYYNISKAYYNWTDNKTKDIPWDGKSYMGIDDLANFIIVGNIQNGIEIIDGENKIVNLDIKVLREIFDIYYNGMVLGYFNEVGSFRSDDVKSGELVSYIGSSSGVAYFPKWIEKDNTELPIELFVNDYPSFIEGKNIAIQQGAGMSISKSTPAKEEGAALFLKWFTAKEQNINFAITTGYLPVGVNAYTDDTFNLSIEQLKNGEKMDRNVANVYKHAYDQIISSGTYAPKAFEGSYEIRKLLEAKLHEITQRDKLASEVLKQKGYSEEQVLEAIKADNSFNEWIVDVEVELYKLNIKYIQS